MNARAVRAIVRRDLMAVTRSKPVMLPMIILPIVIVVVLPALVALAPNMINLPGMSGGQIGSFLQRMPAGLKAELAGLNETQQVIVLMLTYFFAPMFLLLPIMVAIVIAADSFAGEKERKTLEALLYTPTTDGELLLGKMLSSWLPAMTVAFGSFILYSITANLVAGPVIGHVFFPNLMWVVLVLWVAPAAAALGLGVMVHVSARVRGFQEANQLGSMVVIPVLLVLLAQASGVMYFNVGVVILMGAVLWAIDGAIFWYAVRNFHRTRLTEQL